MFIRLPCGAVIDSARLCYVSPRDSAGDYRLTVNIGEGYNSSVDHLYIDAANYDVLVNQLMNINDRACK